jgi:hypothetical protein
MGRRVYALVLVLIILVIVACAKGHHRQNACPIDGQPPQWSGRRNGNLCEYFHYSAVEKTTHSWWADCDLGAAK